MSDKYYEEDVEIPKGYERFTRSAADIRAGLILETALEHPLQLEAGKREMR